MFAGIYHQKKWGVGGILTKTILKKWNILCSIACTCLFRVASIKNPVFPLALHIRIPVTRAEQQGLGCPPVIPWHSHLDLAFPPGLFPHTGSSSNFKTQNDVFNLSKQKIRRSFRNGRGPTEPSKDYCVYGMQQSELWGCSPKFHIYSERWDSVRKLKCFYAAENINAVTCFYSEPQ